MCGSYVKDSNVQIIVTRVDEQEVTAEVYIFLISHEKEMCMYCVFSSCLCYVNTLNQLVRVGQSHSKCSSWRHRRSYIPDVSIALRI